jgi:hypothetical protein
VDTAAVADVLANRIGIALQWIAITVSARCIDVQALALVQCKDALRGDLVDATVGAFNPCLNRCYRLSTIQTPGWSDIALPTYRHDHLSVYGLEHFGGTKTTTVTTSTTRIVAQTVALNAHRIAHLNGFSRNIHTIGGVHFQHVDAILGWTSTDTTGPWLTGHIRHTATGIDTTIEYALINRVMSISSAMTSNLLRRTSRVMRSVAILDLRVV